MDLFSELIAALASDLNVPSTGNTQFPLATLKLGLNRAYRRAGGLFRWIELMDAKKTSTEDGFEYYDYPTNWYPDSIWHLEVDGDQYGEDPDGSPLNFLDYLKWKIDYPSSTDKKWATQHKRYFIWPVPSTDGDNNISIWGQMVVPTLTDDDDTTIWSYSSPEGNDAIVMEAGSILQKKGELKDKGQMSNQQAKEILAVLFNRQRQEKQKHEKNLPFFNVQNFFRQSGTIQNTGKFSSDFDFQ